MVMQIKNIFQERLLKALTSRNMKQIDLAEKTNISKAQISEYVNGKCRPKQDKLYIISTVLNVSPSWLMGFDVPMDKEATTIKKRVLNKIDTLTDVQLETLDILIEQIIKK